LISKHLLNYIEKFEDREQVFLFLTNLRHDLNFGTILSASSLFKLIEDGIVFKDYITSSFTLLIPYYDSDDGNIVVNDYEDIYKNICENIDLYRELFKGIRIGAMGNKKECINRMTDFIINHNTTLDEVIQATMYYLERENPEYIMNADNFINNGKQSKLSIVMEEMPSSRLL